MEIRKATTRDIDAIAEFNCRMALETEGKTLDRDTVLAAVGRVFADVSKGFYLVAVDGGAVVGCLMITYEWSDWRNADWWWIQSVYIVPASRGRGLYGQMYRSIKNMARAEGGVYGIRLYVERENHHAQRVYESLGMERSNYYMYDEEL